MESFGEAIGQALSTVEADPIGGLVLRLALGYLILTWLASALWAFVDLRRRTTSLVAAYGSAAMVILATPLLFPAALLVHIVLRPEGLASERRLDDLRYAAFASDDAPRCPGCSRPIDDAWLVCPSCRRQLGHRCPSCGEAVGLDWSVCGRCGAELDGSVMSDETIRVRA
jgi:hypothetical protein